MVKKKRGGSPASNPNKKKRGNCPASGSSKRRRGAQPGNRNALKHGFYSDQFKRAERRALNEVSMADLTEEIKLLRVQIHRYLESENQVAGETDYETRLSALRAVSFAANSIIRLVRLQTFINLQSEDWKKIEDRLNSIPFGDEDDNKDELDADKS